MTDLIPRARAFATEAHERIDQRRKYTSQPYQEHLKAVAGWWPRSRTTPR
jgi:hypothetical protein